MLMLAQFCFMCVFAGCNGGEGESDDVSQLDDLICSLAKERKEVPWIVNSVFNIYDKHIRPDVSYTHPRTGMIVDQPYWSRESIHTHLIHSNKYPILFDTLCDSIFQNTILLQQDNLVDLDTGRVDENARRGLMCTLKSYTTWRLAQQKLHAIEPTKIGKSFK